MPIGLKEDNDYLCKNIVMLRAENERVWNENARLRAENARLRAELTPPAHADSPLQRAFESHRNTPYEHETTVAAQGPRYWSHPFPPIPGTENCYWYLGLGLIDPSGVIR